MFHQKMELLSIRNRPKVRAWISSLSAQEVERLKLDAKYGDELGKLLWKMVFSDEAAHTEEDSYR